MSAFKAVEGGRRENLLLSIFLASSLAVPRPVGRFDTHPKWPPVMQSACSRRSYGKIEDCEQSS